MNIDTLNKNLLAEMRGRVGVIWLRRPPSNALSSKFLADLDHVLVALLNHSDVDCVVLATGLNHFSAGSETSDFITPKRGSKTELLALCKMVAASQKPIVVAVQGACLSAGLELAISAQARVALVGAQFAFPDIKLGLMPAAGSTLRLPELVGPNHALTMLLEGGAIGAEQAAEIGLIDLIVQGDLLTAACDFALKLAQGTGRLVRRDSVKDARDLQAAVVQARVRYAGRRLASYDKIINCIEAGQIFMQPQAFALEQSAYDSLLFSEDTQGLCYALLASQRFRSLTYTQTATLPNGVAQMDVQHINIFGSGELVAQLAHRALVAGLQIRLVNPEQEGLMNCLLRISVLLAQDITQGRLDPQTRDVLWARLRSSKSTDLFDSSPIFCQQSDLFDGDIYITTARQTPPPEKSILIIAQDKFDYVADPAAPLDILAFLSGFFAKMGISSYDLLRGGYVDAQIKDALSQAISYLQTQGHARDAIIATLAASGVGVDANIALPPAPPNSKPILAAIQLALINRGAIMLRENRVPRATDYDAMVVQAGLFARWLGGPLYCADRRGLMVVRADLRKLAMGAADLFTPDPLFDHMIAKGRLFTQ